MQATSEVERRFMSVDTLEQMVHMYLDTPELLAEPIPWSQIQQAPAALATPQAEVRFTSVGTCEQMERMYLDILEPFGERPQIQAAHRALRLEKPFMSVVLLDPMGHV